VLLLSLGVELGCPGSARSRHDGSSAREGTIVVPDPDRGLAKEQSVTKADLAQGTRAGDPCPCAAPLVCANKVCRTTCQVVECNGKSSCGDTETCLNSKSAGAAVCVPGAANGAACSASQPCAAGSLCAANSTGSTEGTCRATCTEQGAECSGGGTCQATEGTCLICY
jgi:hypothetical protein